MMSSEFIFLTLFFLVNSFWANFYIGTFDMQLGDKHNLTGEQRHEFAQYFTLFITLGKLALCQCSFQRQASTFSFCPYHTQVCWRFLRWAR